MNQAPDLELVLPALPENVAVVRQMLAGVAAVIGLEADGLDDVRLAVSEACANAVVHGYAGTEPGLMAISVTCARDALSVTVRDNGRGMAPRPDSPGLGVGLPLIAAMAQTMELTAPSGGGTEVRMTFDLAESDSETDDESHRAAERRHG